MNTFIIAPLQCDNTNVSSLCLKASRQSHPEDWIRDPAFLRLSELGSVAWYLADSIAAACCRFYPRRNGSTSDVFPHEARLPSERHVLEAGEHAAFPEVVLFIVSLVNNLLDQVSRVTNRSRSSTPMLYSRRWTRRNGWPGFESGYHVLVVLVDARLPACGGRRSEILDNFDMFSPFWTPERVRDACHRSFGRPTSSGYWTSIWKH